MAGGPGRPPPSLNIVPVCGLGALERFLPPATDRVARAAFFPALGTAPSAIQEELTEDYDETAEERLLKNTIQSSDKSLNP
jgi:hypothetical protein